MLPDCTITNLYSDQTDKGFLVCYLTPIKKLTPQGVTPSTRMPKVFFLLLNSLGNKPLGSKH